MKQSIQQILAENPHTYFEVVYAPGGRLRANYTQILGSSYGWENNVLEDRNLWDLPAEHYEEMDESMYIHCIRDIGCISWADFAESDDPDATVLIITVSHFTYRVMTDSSLSTVRDVRTDHIGQFAMYYVIRPDRGGYESEMDDDDYYYEGNDYEPDDDEIYRIPATIVRGPLDKLNRMWAEDSFMVGEKELTNEGFTYDIDNEDDWWWKESFEEHFGNSDAKILFIVLA